MNAAQPVGEVMSVLRSVGQGNNLPTSRVAVTIATALLLVAAGCGAGVENANNVGSNPAALSTSSKPSTRYAFEFFDVPEATKTIPQAINDFGVVVGDFISAAGRRGFIRTPSGQFTTIAADGAVVTRAGDINDFGIVVGFSQDLNGTQTGFARAPNGRLTRIVFPSPPGVSTGPSGINNLGNIVGGYDFGDHNFDIGFLLAGHFATLPDPPSAASMQNYPGGINDWRLISGSFVDAAGIQHGYLLRGATYVTVDYPGELVSTQLSHLNNRSEVVGVSDSAGGFMFDAKSNAFTPVECPNGFEANVMGINNRGQITGSCRSEQGGPVRGFIATPVHSDE